MAGIFITAALALVMVLTFAYTAWRWGIIAAVPAAIVALLSFFFNRNLDGALIISIAALLGILSGFVVKGKISLTHYLVSATLLIGSLGTGQYYVLKNYYNIDALQQSRLMVEEQIKKAPLSDDQKTTLTAQFKENQSFIENKMPFFFFLQALVYAALTLMAVKLFMTRVHRVSAGKGLELFRLSDYFIFALIAGLGTVLLVDGEKYPQVYQAALNLGLTTALFYFVQAMGVIKFYFIKRNMPRFLFPVMFLFLFLSGPTILPFFLVVLAGFGALDLWADFRKLNTAEKTEV